MIEPALAGLAGGVVSFASRGIQAWERRRDQVHAIALARVHLQQAIAQYAHDEAIRRMELAAREPVHDDQELDLEHGAPVARPLLLETRAETNLIQWTRPVLAVVLGVAVVAYPLVTGDAALQRDAWAALANAFAALVGWFSGDRLRVRA